MSFKKTFINLSTKLKSVYATNGSRGLEGVFIKFENWKEEVYWISTAPEGLFRLNKHSIMLFSTLIVLTRPINGILALISNFQKHTELNRLINQLKSA